MILIKDIETVSYVNQPDRRAADRRKTAKSIARWQAIFSLAMFAFGFIAAWYLKTA